MRNFKLVISILMTCLLFADFTQAQDVTHVKSIVKELASEKYHGRCYTNRGADKAANYIQSKFEDAGLQPVEKQWMQPFSFDINQIKKVKLKIDGKELLPGADYVVRRNSPSVKGTWELKHVTPEHLKNPLKMAALLKSDIEKHFFVVDIDDFRKHRKMYDSASKMLFLGEAKKFILLQEAAIKDYVVYGRRKSESVVISIRKKAFNDNAKSLSIKLKTAFNNITTNNVMAMLPSESEHDSVIIICGHYDHLGEMGPKTWFPGADDNASSIAAMIELASYLKDQQNPPEKNILFVGFSGEEAGLIGSKYFTENLPVQKSNICYVLNLDMIGFGKSGLQIWNGKNETRLVKRLKNINSRYELLDTLIIKENTPNSDHHYFTKKDIPALFFSTGVAPSKYYHTVYDTYENTDLAKMREILQLVARMVMSEESLSVQK